MSKDTATYDPKSVIITIGGNPITGFPDGSFIKAERNSDGYSAHVGIDGKVTRVKNNDKTGKIAVTLKHNSPSNRIFEQYARSGQIFDINITDKNFTDNVSVGGSEAWVEKPASFERGKDVSDREWSIFVSDYDQVFEAFDAGTINS
jgi:hypothetical protein